MGLDLINLSQDRVKCGLFDYDPVLGRSLLGRFCFHINNYSSYSTVFPQIFELAIFSHCPITPKF